MRRIGTFLTRRRLLQNGGGFVERPNELMDKLS